MSRLILNADDFGLTAGINRAIGELAAAGALTSATLMASGPAFDDAVAVARAHPALGVGCHIVLTDGVPISPPASIPSLIGPDGKSFHPTLAGFMSALLRGRIRSEDISRETLAQIQKLQKADINVTHIDTHKHTHIFSGVALPVLHAARLAGVHAVRNPFEPAWSASLSHGTLRRRIAVRLLNRMRPHIQALIQLENQPVLTTDGTIAISATGDLTSTTLAEILAALPSAGTFELCCHPGYNDADLDRIATRLRAHRDREREALLAEIPRLLTQPNAPTLISYSDLR